MNISVLNENTAGKRLSRRTRSGLLIEHEGKRWLFDTGQTDVFMKNAALLGERLMGLNGIILSHGHFDHCGASNFWRRISEGRICLPFMSGRQPSWVRRQSTAIAGLTAS